MLRHGGRRTLDWTPEAVTLVRSLSDRSADSHVSGVRITVDRGTRSLRMTVEDAPSVEDTVLSRDGARLFVCPDALERLGGARLHADLGPRKSFLLDREPPPKSWLWAWTGGLIT